MISRQFIAAIGIAIVATATVWLLVMPNEPETALQDGAGAAPSPPSSWARQSGGEPDNERLSGAIG